MIMALCRTCGADIPEEARVCPYCGNPVEKAEEMNAPEPQPQYAAPEQPQYAAPEQPQYAAPEQPQYGAPQQPQYAAPQQPQYAAPQQPQYGAPQQPQYAAPQQPQYGAPQQQPYGAQSDPFTAQQQFGMPQNGVPAGPMPNASGYLVMVILGFLLGIIWGALSIGHYNKMKEAIAMNDSVSANSHAKKIRTFFIIGLVVNILLIIGQVVGS